MAKCRQFNSLNCVSLFIYFCKMKRQAANSARKVYEPYHDTSETGQQSSTFSCLILCIPELDKKMRNTWKWCTFSWSKKPTICGLTNHLFLKIFFQPKIKCKIYNWTELVGLHYGIAVLSTVWTAKRCRCCTCNKDQAKKRDLHNKWSRRTPINTIAVHFKSGPTSA